MSNRIKCPLMKSDIEEDICFDISMVAEEIAPINTMPDRVREQENFKDICLKCPNHRFD